MGRKTVYNQLCVWPGTVLGSSSAREMEKFFKQKGFRVRFCEEVKTLPDVDNGRVVEGTGGRIDIFFYIHDEDIVKFAIPRLSMGIRWWEDVLANGGGSIYPQKILDKYPPKW